MQPQKAVVLRQSMSASLYQLSDRLRDERARIERALKDPGSVVISEPSTPRSLTNGSTEVTPRDIKKEPASELMQQGNLALEFKLLTSVDKVIAVAQKYDSTSEQASWFKCAADGAPMHTSKDYLTHIRQFAASRSLSMIVKTGSASLPAISPSPFFLAPILGSVHSPTAAAKLASTSLQTIPSRSSQLSSGNQTPTTSQNLVPKLSITSVSTPNIAATISASGGRSIPSLSESSINSSKGDTDSDEDWAIDDDFVPDRSDTPPLPAAKLVSV